MINDNEIAMLADMLRKEKFIPEHVEDEDIFKDGVLNLAGHAIVLKNIEAPDDNTLIVSFNVENAHPYIVSEFTSILMESGLMFEYGNGFVVRGDELIAKETFNS